ncbi:MAG: translocation protein TolB [Syntrophorhabdus sp. PtaB.Bin184]|jgi:TolB protein|nr:MAG: translocation protein TolB [Syntrophorhabdus sp. PtaB.Bin184]
MRKHSFVAIMSALAVMLMFSSVSQAKVYLTITGETFKKITIGVPYFKGEKAAGSSLGMSDLLNKDLDFSGFFITAPASLIDRELLDEGVEKGEVKFASWRSIGIDIVCKGRLSVANGELSLEAFVYDTLDGSMVLAKRYKARQNEWRRVTHRLADDIIFAVTGEKGIMSSRVLFTAGRRNLKEIYLSDFDGQNVARLTNYRSITLSPSLSPNGKYLAYTSYRDGRPNLYVTDFDKKNEIFVERSEGMKIGTSWLNNSTLVYSHTSGRTSTIYAFDVGSRSKKVLVQRDGILTSPTVSPDGSRLVFVSDMFGTPQIFSKALPSGEPKRLTYHGKYNSAPAFSPKGDLIAFVANISGGFEICTMNADGSNQRVLTNDGTVNDSPQFSACGRYIIYTSLKGGVNRLNVMLFNGENKRTLRFTDFAEEQPRFAP